MQSTPYGNYLTRAIHSESSLDKKVLCAHCTHLHPWKKPTIHSVSPLKPVVVMKRTDNVISKYTPGFDDSHWATRTL